MTGLGWGGKEQIIWTTTSTPLGRCAGGNGEVTGGNSLGESQRCTQAGTKLSAGQ